MIYSEKIKEAAQLAFICHGGQQDKAGYPYIMHPLHLAEQMDDEDSVIVALLHDTVEDAGISLAALLEHGFSAAQVAAIRALTHDKETDYLEYIKKQVKPNALATKVKIADLTHNMDLSRLNTVTEKDLERVKKYEKALSILNQK